LTGESVHTGSVLTPSQVLALEPNLTPNLIGAIRFPSTACATANPLKRMLALRSNALKKGVNIQEFKEVFEIQNLGGKYKISIRDTKSELVDVNPTVTSYMQDIQTIVITSGALTPYVGALIKDLDPKLLPIIPVIGQMFSTPNN